MCLERALPPSWSIPCRTMTPHDDLLQTVAETLSVAQELVKSMSTLTCLTPNTNRPETTEHETEGSSEENEETLADHAVEQNGNRGNRGYHHRILVLASEESVHAIVDRESAAQPPGAIVAIEFEMSADVADHVILVLEAILLEFPHLCRLVVDMQVAGDSLKHILRLVTTLCPHISSYSFKHVVTTNRP